MTHRVALLASLALLVTCTAPPTVPEGPLVPPPESAGAWSLDASADSLVAQSCPDAGAYQAPLPITVTASPVTLGPPEAVEERLPDGVTYAGGWVLSSDNESFGGLSDLDLDAEGDLLSVSDDGAFVWIGLTDGVPDGTGKLAYMLGADGRPLQGKRLGDAEGLSVHGHLAIVSFERSHRISAFALEACGAAAREAEISALPGSHAGRMVDENRGAEALTVTPEGHIVFGYETVGDGVSPMGSVAGPGLAGWTGDTAPNPAGYALVAVDAVSAGDDDETFWLFRSYDPIRGNRNVVRWGPSGQEITITRPLVTDNFEGIAAEDLGDGTVRLWILSDDNFNPRQRTLLLAFDITARSE